MKVKNFYFQIRVPIYRVIVVVYQGPYFKRMAGLFAEHDCTVGEEQVHNNATAYYCPQAPIFGIAMSVFDHSPEGYGDLHHEITHVAMRILERACVHLSPDNHEPLSYLIGYLTEKIYDKLIEL